MLFDGHTFKHGGSRFLVNIRADDEWRVPWKEEYGHGPVTGWTRRTGKRPGELVLADDRRLRLYYDYQEACKIALRDGWGADGDAGMTRRQKAAHAARADFERLRQFCAGLWDYVGVTVTLLDDFGDPMPYSASLGGIESDADEAIEEVARDLAEDVMAQLRAELAA